jgi:hypothetical protein
MNFAFLPSLGPPELIILFLFGLWIWALIDIIRRTDFSGMTKAIWIVAMLFFAFATAIIYLIVKLVSKKPVPNIKTFSGD